MAYFLWYSPVEIISPKTIDFLFVYFYDFNYHEYLLNISLK